MIRFDPMQKQTKMVYGVNPAGGATVVLLYVMFSAPNAPTSAAQWQIQKLTYDASDNLLTIQFPRNSDGNASADYAFVADNYATHYTYGAA